MLRSSLRKLKKALKTMYGHLALYIDKSMAFAFMSRKPLRALDMYNKIVMKYPYLGLPANFKPREIGCAEADMLLAFYNSANISLNTQVKSDAAYYLRRLCEFAPCARVRELSDGYLAKLK